MYNEDTTLENEYSSVWKFKKSKITYGKLSTFVLKTIKNYNVTEKNNKKIYIYKYKALGMLQSADRLNKILYYKIVIYSGIFCDYIDKIIIENHNGLTTEVHFVTYV